MREGPMRPPEAQHLMTQVLDALCSAHDLGVIHRDLKPANIMVTNMGARRNAMVLDFGIATYVKAVRDEGYQSLTPDGSMGGTPAYMAPEQLHGQESNPQSDIYAWGLVFLECLTGQRVVRGGTMAQNMFIHLRPEPHAVPPVIAAHPLGRVLRKALAKDPTQRYADARNALNELLPCDVTRLPRIPRSEQPAGTGRTPLMSTADPELASLQRLPTSMEVEPTEHWRARGPAAPRSRADTESGSGIRGTGWSAMPRARGDTEPVFADEDTEPDVMRSRGIERGDAGEPGQSRSGEGTTDSLAMLMPALSFCNDEPRSQPVRLGASAPRRVRPGQEFTARLAAYNLALLRRVRKALRQRGVKIHENLAETSWKTGAKVRVTLAGVHLTVKPAAQEFVWEGKLHTVDFDVEIRGDIEEDTVTRLKFDVFLMDVPGCEAVPVARVRLDLEIRRKRDWLGRPCASRVQFAAQPAFQAAYASYHAADRVNVLTRLDAIQQLTGMKFFYECLSVDPSTTRKFLLAKKILERDLFLLFWSRRAADSREVEWEWRTALERKGLEAMQAQRLEGEALLPPELEPLDRTADGQNLAALGSSLASVVMRKSKILFVAANPLSSEHRALDQEAREITAKIRACKYRDALLFHTRWAVRPDDLLQALNEDRPAVVHFSGHGTGERGIVLHDDLGAARLVTAKALRRLFTALQGEVRLVVLNACYSHDQALAVAEVIDCVIGMSDRIGDDAARAFAASFYRALGFGRSVRSAFDQGLAAIALEGLGAEHVPRLLARAGVDPGTVYIVTEPGKASSDLTGTDVCAGP
jgi:hypothetical protein